MRTEKLVKTMANKTINVEALCPFFVTENPKSITCEGVIGKVQFARFDTIENKKTHQSFYCTSRNYENCPQFMAVLKKYE